MDLPPELAPELPAEYRTGKSARPVVSFSRVFRALKGVLDDWKIRLSRRGRRRGDRRAGRRATSVNEAGRGRAVRHRRPARFPPAHLAFLPTVRNAILRGGRALPLRPIRDDLREEVHEGKAPLTIVLVVDVSSSTADFLEPVARVLSILYRDAYRNRDRLGLVAIAGGVARIVNHPTRNLKSVLGNLTRLTPSGLTPLGDALARAREVLTHERRRQPLHTPLAVLLTDGHPEPVTKTGDALMTEPAYQQVLTEARNFRRLAVPIVVINPAHGRFPDGRVWYGTRLAMQVARITGGRYHGLPVAGARAAGDTKTLKALLAGKQPEQGADFLREMLGEYRQGDSTFRLPL